MKNFKNEELENIVNIAKDNNLQVWTFETSSSKIEQVFITDGKNIGTCSADYSGVSFGTVHKPCKECGTGFGLQSDHIINSDIENIKESMFGFAPNWSTFSQRKAVVKYTDWNEYLSKNTILKYYQL